MTTQAEQALAAFNAENAKDGGIQAEVTTTAPLAANQMLTGDAAAAEPAAAAPAEPHKVDAGVKAVEDQLAADAAAAPASPADKNVDEITDSELLALSPEEIEKMIEKVEKQELQPEPQAAAPAKEPAPQPTAQKADSPMIPKARLDEVLAEKDRLKEENAFLKGRDSVTQPNKQQPQQQQAPVQTQIAAIDGALGDINRQFNQHSDEIATKFDQGEITMLEAKRQERELAAWATKESNRLKQNRVGIIQRANTPAPEVVEAEIQSDPGLLAATEKLSSENQFMNNIPDELFDQVVATATAAMQQRYKGNIPMTPAATLQMRQTAIAVAKKWGLDKGFAGAAPAAPATGNLQQVTAQQRSDKLTMAKNHPPSIALAGEATNAGHGAAVAGSYTDKDLSGMRDIDIAASLPKSALDKALGITK